MNLGCDNPVRFYFYLMVRSCLNNEILNQGLIK